MHTCFTGIPSFGYGLVLHVSRHNFEYRRRLQVPQKSQEPEGLDAQMGKLRRGIARLIDSYAEGFIDKQEFEPRVTRMRQRLQHLEEQLRRLKEEAEGEEALRAILGRLETFAAKVNTGLHDADFQSRREIIRALVKRVEIDEQQIRVVFRVSPLASAPPFEGASPNLAKNVLNWEYTTEILRSDLRTRLRDPLHAPPPGSAFFHEGSSSQSQGASDVQTIPSSKSAIGGQPHV